MSKKMKTFLKWVLIMNAFIVATLIYSFKTAGMSRDQFDLLVELYTPFRIGLGFFVVEIIIVLACWAQAKENQVILDEREQLIELKSYKTTYRITWIVMAGFMLASLFTDGLSKPATVQINSVLLILAMSYVISQKYYRSKG